MASYPPRRVAARETGAATAALVVMAGAATAGAEVEVEVTNRVVARVQRQAPPYG